MLTTLFKVSLIQLMIYLKSYAPYKKVIKYKLKFKEKRYPKIRSPKIYFNKKLDFQEIY